MNKISTPRRLHCEFTESHVAAWGAKGLSLAMFQSKTHLPHLLRPDQYRSQQQYALEVDRLFLDAWHLVGTTADMPKDGDFLTIDLLGHPLLLRNFDGEIHTFLNVCAHRHCRLTDKARGSDSRLRCQYHGWEYDETGETRRIPDASSFRPFPKGMVHLRKYRTETAGQLVFVNLADQGPDLAEYLGPYFHECRQMFSDEWEQIWGWQPVSEGNWKLAYEITLEGYHVQCAHADSLGQFPPARDEASHHELLSESHSAFRADRSQDSFPALDWERFAVRACGGDPKSEYTHLHVYPHAGFITQNIFAIAQSILPTSPTRHQNLYRLFVYRGVRRGLLPWIVKRAAANRLRDLWSQTFREDAQIVAETQLGMSAPAHAAGGLISIREERVFHFQEFINRRLEKGPGPFSADFSTVASAVCHHD